MGGVLVSPSNGFCHIILSKVSFSFALSLTHSPAAAEVVFSLSRALKGNQASAAAAAAAGAVFHYGGSIRAAHTNQQNRGNQSASEWSRLDGWRSIKKLSTGKLKSSNLYRERLNAAILSEAPEKLFLQLEKVKMEETNINRCLLSW
jgi:hypothetical protein